MSGYHNIECETCTRTFSSQISCNQHMNALNHWAERYECDACSDVFFDEDERDDHMNDLDHWRWDCETCSRQFASVGAQEQHMDALGHWKHYCKLCQRHFVNANNLRMHLNSNTHRGSNVPCPFCKRGFTTASGVCHHLETGSCPNTAGVNRQTIYNAIRERDPQGNFTNKLLEWHQETTWSTSNAFNGHRFECYLCHRQFDASAHLDQHLKSPAHMQQIYHCPNHRDCGAQFKTLAAMFNHLESERCGFMKFEAVQKQTTNFLTGGSKQLRLTG